MLLKKTTSNAASRIASKAMGATRSMSGKEIKFGVEGRAAMLKGVNMLADAVQVSMTTYIGQCMHHSSVT